MGRKKKNNLKRIEQGNTFNDVRKQVYKNNEEAGEEIVFILESNSPPLTNEELEIIQSMGDGVYFKPRTRKTTIIEPGTLKKWQLLGFTSFRHYTGFNSFNNQVGGVTETDLMQHLIDTLASNKRSN
ncbi:MULTISPECIES: hypothetical protein [Enterobacteriaceae]|uniref:Uncharacterized protein n=2 Tax=Escherichia coli TaxID=562 RepID=A0AAJ1EMV6_ECOLX|nr:MULTISPECIES: hypothetical protein [Enterobacteriaceae]AKH25281.1 hypothetical protein AA102_15805 [Escherichia coli]AUL66952.1 hypothetical protein BVL39_01630 [Escherichia coli]AVN12483.1 hypothetical protein CSC11_1908 [Escherichia coli]AWF15122.1 hypothetical protein CSC23_1902 [Escherichia coli]AWJ06268.1 hypothetical protein DEP49_18955 [Escherichia coli]